MSLIESIDLQHHVHPSGSLVVAQSELGVPFAIRRTYFVYGVPEDQLRGRHAHKTLTQLALCARGRCRFRLDDGHETAELLLDRPNLGIILRPMVWHEMFDFSDDCVLLVLASAHYDEGDYIRDYNEFKRAVAKR
jgi:dTDP-4-dehydrorhamnose 3,5-epimerase